MHYVILDMNLYMHLCMESAKKRMTCNRTMYLSIISGEKVV